MTGVWTSVGHEDSISMGCLDGAGRRLLTVAFDKTARVWDIRSGRCLAVLQHPQQLIRGSMAPHGHTVVTVTADHVAHLWDVRSGQLLHSFEVGSQERCCRSIPAYIALFALLASLVKHLLQTIFIVQAVHHFWFVAL